MGSWNLVLHRKAAVWLLSLPLSPPDHRMAIDSIHGPLSHSARRILPDSSKRNPPALLLPIPPDILIVDLPPNPPLPVRFYPAPGVDCPSSAAFFPVGSCKESASPPILPSDRERFFPRGTVHSFGANPHFPAFSPFGGYSSPAGSFFLTS